MDYFEPLGKAFSFPLVPAATNHNGEVFRGQRSTVVTSIFGPKYDVNLTYDYAEGR
jgi:hypothetical protein